MPLKKPLILLALFAHGWAWASTADLVGPYQGEGQQCYGKLVIREKTVEWRAPLSKCGPAHYDVLPAGAAAGNTENVFLLKPASSCDFGIIAVSSDPADPGYVTATGYRSLEDYNSKSDDFLGCRMRMLAKKKLSP